MESSSSASSESQEIYEDSELSVHEISGALNQKVPEIEIEHEYQKMTSLPPKKGLG